MRLFRGSLPFWGRSGGFREGSRVRNKLLMALIPPIILVLLATGYITYSFSRNYLNTALQRVARVQSRAMAHAVEEYLRERKRDLLFIAHGPASTEAIRETMARAQRAGMPTPREVGYFGPDQQQGFLLLMNDEGVFEVDVPPASSIQLLADVRSGGAAPLEPGEVRIGSVETAEYTLPAQANEEPKTVQAQVVRLLTRGADGGYFVLSMDAASVRDILSVYTSPKSPLWAYPRTPEVRYAFLFDTRGWMLFQSEETEQASPEMGTYLARAGLSGTLGRPGLPAAFRPGAAYGDYWRMVDEVGQGKHDLIVSREGADLSQYINDYYLSYSPVRFLPGGGKPAQIYCGLAYVDRTRMTLTAGYKQVDIIFLVTLSTILLISIIIFFISRRLTRPIIELSREVNTIQETGLIRPIELKFRDYETGGLTEAINNLISTVQRQMDEIRHMDLTIQTASLKERAELESIIKAAAAQEVEIAEIVGFGPQVERLKADIAKAAQVDADVLITGETGTGKQLAAEAVHRLSRRSAKPFVSINCGALDENLLLDTLFGHVRGAYTEAKAERKGAFQEADGGTLFLDEIQTASPKVQQALLRAIAMRRFRPLGSDKEVDVDVRLIAATNVDLRQEIDEGGFRQDLYYRLKVLTIETIPLRQQKSNIPVLADRFLKQAEPVSGKKDLGLSKGALENLMAYDWPGNIRELQNCMTMAAVMVEGNLIQASDLRLDDNGRQGPALPLVAARASTQRSPEEPRLPEEPRQPWEPRPSKGGSMVDKPGEGSVSEGGVLAAPAEDLPMGLNQRQAKVYPFILQEGGVTRNRYQEIVGGNLSARTANYDLGELVLRGLLIKIGRGPATRYEVRRPKAGG
ncbi:sigma 54-interacting transcriptional regulator [Desulfocurvibacter africanus]|uniref:sigma 54-interacting transcriptional regulator n=1 Tax=Desulfocurvibacter africanus TaxID=873 RepID=UPI00047FCB4E|nr:sigma 54-interacting transcriptional regulator [Desulfocurvibacter africanus]